jgi:hypothetical protein
MLDLMTAETVAPEIPPSRVMLDWDVSLLCPQINPSQLISYVHPGSGGPFC